MSIHIAPAIRTWFGLPESKPQTPRFDYLAENLERLLTPHSNRPANLA